MKEASRLHQLKQEHIPPVWIYDRWFTHTQAVPFVMYREEGPVLSDRKKHSPLECTTTALRVKERKVEWEREREREMKQVNTARTFLNPPKHSCSLLYYPLMVTKNTNQTVSLDHGQKEWNKKKIQHKKGRGELCVHTICL